MMACYGRLIGSAAVVFLAAITQHASAHHKFRLEVDLSGEWRLEIGDEKEYSARKYNDDDWEKVSVPNAWENEGFPGYDGYAWYRRTFFLPGNLEGRKLFLHMGRIDDVDFTYVNGHLVGATGGLPPDYRTEWETKRSYELSPEYLRFGRENTVAVRVYDAQYGGGIYAGRVGVYSQVAGVVLKMDLTGSWRFRTGDDTTWAARDFADTGWGSLNVPGTWESQGFEKYDGFAWYRRSIKFPKAFAREKLILLMGRIDDRDAVYFNGALIGATGRFPEGKDKNHCQECYSVERGYFIPPELIRPGRENVVAVRVFDHGGGGGIYLGSVGVATREEYLRYTKQKK